MADIFMTMLQIIWLLAASLSGVLVVLDIMTASDKARSQDGAVRRMKQALVLFTIAVSSKVLKYVISLF